MRGIRASRSLGVSSVPVRVLPDDGAAHADPDAHRGDAVAHLRVLLELPGELGHEPYAGRRERVAEGDGAAVGVDPRVVVLDAEVVEESEHLDGERLVELEEP